MCGAGTLGFRVFFEGAGGGSIRAVTQKILCQRGVHRPHHASRYSTEDVNDPGLLRKIWGIGWILSFQFFYKIIIVFPESKKRRFRDLFDFECLPAGYHKIFSDIFHHF